MNNSGWEQKQKRKAEMVWPCEEKGHWIYWTKDIENGATRQEEKG